MKKFLCEYGPLSYLNFCSQCWALDFVCVELDLVEKQLGWYEMFPKFKH